MDSAPLCAWVGICLENRGNHALGVTGPFCGEHAGADRAIPTFGLTLVEGTCWAVCRARTGAQLKRGGDRLSRSGLRRLASHDPKTLLTLVTYDACGDGPYFHVDGQQPLSPKIRDEILEDAAALGGKGFSAHFG